MDITLAHSPDADDAFMFYALAKDLIDTGAYVFKHTLADIQTLNERARETIYDVTALSVAAYPRVADKYQILPCGASMGDGYGPVVVSREPLTKETLAQTTIAVPGLETSAYLALKLWLHPVEPTVEVVKFDEIMQRVNAGNYPAGLLIHEGQLTHPEHGLRLVEDLGAWWKAKTGFPLPLGINAIKRSIPEDTKGQVVRLLRESISYALGHETEAVAYALDFAREVSKTDTKKFIGMYVNDMTLDIGATGIKAIKLFLESSEHWNSASKSVIDIALTDDATSCM